MPPTTTEAQVEKKEQAILISQYPREESKVRRGVFIAVALHITAAALVCFVTYLMGIQTLRDLLSHGGSIAESGPAPEEPMTVELQLDETPPPPTPNPEFKQEIIKPKVTPPPVVPKKSLPKPDKPKPRYTAPNAKGEGKTQNISAARVGSSGLPSPSYPAAALNAHEGGTVVMTVVFGSDGGVASASVATSSGVTVLDVSTRNFIYGHWKNAGLAGTSISIPIIYDPGNQTVRGGG